ncbi:MAG: hypothetical protein CM15mP22_0030 [Gammaproteobacteria bacterium]|nr:MAG: hypothetical protein CM15mP22_0030 [Gammaproteobacteria bacterium]
METTLYPLTITQYTDADAQSALTAGTNIDITNGVISSTDTNTEYTQVREIYD